MAQVEADPTCGASRIRAASKGCLFATAFHQFRNRPLIGFDARRLGGSHPNPKVRFAEVVIREIERDRSTKVFQLLAECVGKPGKPAAVHPQCVVLLLNVRRGNTANIRLARNAQNCLNPLNSNGPAQARSRARQFCGWTLGTGRHDVKPHKAGIAPAQIQIRTLPASVSGKSLHKLSPFS